MTNTLIIAPHPDDEIIGCWEVIKKVNNVHVFYATGRNTVETQQALNALSVQPFPIDTEIEEYLHPQETGEKNPFDLEYKLSHCLPISNIQILAPDPTFETHPEHRRWGLWAERLFRERHAKVYFYSINMQAPYIHELSPADAQEKRKMLECAYPEKRELWQYEHKYFLFEGRCQWNPEID